MPNTKHYDWKKNIFDKFFSLSLIILLSPILLLSLVLSTWDTKSFGIFTQERIGQWGEKFIIFKLKTMQTNTKNITKTGAFLRKTKLDELPQLFNILLGDMSFVGPRPDEVGYYDQLKGDDRKVLALKPGLTSEASLKYIDEEQLLAQQKNPLQYNDEVIFPDKIQLNLQYLENHSIVMDMMIIWKTIVKYCSSRNRPLQ
jgi:lipopolysaccharide/colanic/teichoic acid biosynthesis glycosyltransferase